MTFEYQSAHQESHHLCTLRMRNVEIFLVFQMLLVTVLLQKLPLGNSEIFGILSVSAVNKQGEKAKK